VVDTSVLAKSNMDRREYLYIVLYYDVLSISVVINKPLYIGMLLNFLTYKSQFRPWLPVALSWDCTNDLSLKMHQDAKLLRFVLKNVTVWLLFSYFLVL
jgi:hypothetical protein